MDIIIYVNSSADNAVNKTLSAIATVSGNLKEDSSVIDPVFIISNNQTVFKCNYLYCSTFGRYYFIRNIKAVTGGRTEIECHVDVLMTYADNIKALKGVVSRQTNNYNLYQQDNAFSFRADNHVTISNLPNQIPAKTRYILAVTG